MFKKEENQHKNMSENTGKVTQIGSSVKIEGDFISEENVQIEGAFIGTLKTKQDLIVKDQAVLEAEIQAGNLFLSGKIKGNVTVKGRIELTASAEITGDIICQSISIETGAKLNGKCTSGKIETPKETPENENLSKREKRNS